MKLARVLGVTGRVMITAGVLILLFVAYQLWGTGFQTARAQDRLEDEFERELEANAPEEPEETAAGDEPGAQPELPALPPHGEGVGRIEIPAIGADWIFLEGVDLDTLKDGPGHYEGTPLPGEPGNAAIAGHRTTYGQPFHNLDNVGDGDRVRITYINGAQYEYSYLGTEIVRPGDVHVIQDRGDDRLTLTACHPKYSARERIVVSFALLDDPAPAGERPEAEEPVQLDLDGEEASTVPAFLWAGASGSIWLAAWVVGRVWRRWPAYLTGLPFFLAALFVFFENFSRLLPANY